MCVLIYVPAGVKTPSKSVLKACCQANPDGQGFAVPGHVFKSLDFEAFYSALSKWSDRVPRIIHARYATTGSVCRDNCHPFRKNGIVFAHNGVLPIRPTTDRTDSEEAFLTYVYPAVDKYGLHTPEVDAVIESIIGSSKFAVMDRTGDVRLFGPFYERDGVYYSNLNWVYRLNTIRCNAYDYAYRFGR